jgi:hypothetical protein
MEPPERRRLSFQSIDLGVYSPGENRGRRITTAELLNSCLRCCSVSDDTFPIRFPCCRAVMKSPATVISRPGI